MVRTQKTVVTRVPKEMKDIAKMWQRLKGAKTEYEGWQQVHKIYLSKSNKIFDKEIFKL